MPNALGGATSPYLLQHADNPVDWFEWGDDAFAAARERDVPIFLSVGYSACHWCHVMAHESFEDEAIAAQLNAAFVNVKVDREERPDVDAVYMNAVTALTGHGGWPMSVFATPDGQPFFAGTYWPREPRHGMASFPQVIAAVADAWTERREEVVESAARITATLAEATAPAGGVPGDVPGGVAGDVREAFDPTFVDEAVRLVLARAWDRTHGGFGRAPKFPQAMTLEWLLHHHARTGAAEPLHASVQALDAMARGGIHDQLAGGFARYSTDAQWLVPHFEKMLYDNALLLPVYATAAALTSRDDLAGVTRATAEHLLGELRTGDGLFVSAVDADSEGVEGRYYVWSHDEFTEVVAGADADPDVFARYFGVRAQGNWEGVNILHRPVDDDRFVADHGLDPADFAADLARVRAALLARRRQRVAPQVDDKILTDWNALTVRGLVVAGRLLDEPGWIAAAAATADALDDMMVADGRLHHAARGGIRGVGGFLEDHAALALADLELFGATGEERFYTRGLRLAEEAHERFHDAAAGGWFQTAHDAEPLVTRPMDRNDNATPAGSSLMVEVCLALGDLTGQTIWQDRAEQALSVFEASARAMPTGFGWLLRQCETLAATRREVAIVGPPGEHRDRLERHAVSTPRPGTRVVVAPDTHTGVVPLLAGRGPVEGRAAVYVCHGHACQRPVTDVGELAALLGP